LAFITLTGRFREHLSPIIANCMAEAIGYLHRQICSFTLTDLCDVAATRKPLLTDPEILRVPSLVSQRHQRYRAGQIQYGSVPIAAESAAARALGKT
jgi:hypothetical protein